MKIELHQIPIKEALAEYADKGEEGVTAFSGRLDVRPAYQREFIYKDKQRDAVIRSVMAGLPLNVMYWVKSSPQDFGVLDGQQRTISIGQYLDGDFSIDKRYFSNLTDKEQQQILDYELMVYICTGTNVEQLAWFKTINIAGEKLNDQELRNAVYTGPWLSDAKLTFSKTECAAYLLANDGGRLVKGSPIRQELLETALEWINDGDVEDYMAQHQADANAKDLWSYFQSVLSWARVTFPEYRKEMASVKWGPLYNEYGKRKLDPAKLERQVAKLMQDEDVTKKSGIYEFVLSGEERLLSIRTFDDRIKREAFERQKGICPACGKKFKIEEMEADHITPWSKGGKTISENCQMLCASDNRTKSGV